MKKYYRFFKLFISVVWEKRNAPTAYRIGILTAWKVSGMVALNYPLKSPILSTNKDSKA